MNIWFFIILSAATCLITSIYIASQWKVYSHYSMKLFMLREMNFLIQIWPVDDKFYSLHWVSIRGFVFSVIGCVLHFVVNIKWISFVYCMLMLALAMVNNGMQKARKAEYLSKDGEMRKYLTEVKKACTATFILRYVLYALQVLAFWFRPL